MEKILRYCFDNRINLYHLNLLIIGAGQFDTVAKEIAEAMGCFDKIYFLDDTFGQGETEVNYHEQSIGKLCDLENFIEEYYYAICSIGNAELRKEWTDKIIKAHYMVPILSSPLAYISKSAQLSHGNIIEPYTVVHANVALGIAAFVSAGAVVNHSSFVSDYCHINCNTVVMSGAMVAPGTKTQPCEVVRANPIKYTIKNVVEENVEVAVAK